MKEFVLKGWVCKDKGCWRSDWDPAKFCELKPHRVYVDKPPRWIWDEDDHWEMEGNKIYDEDNNFKRLAFETKLPIDMFPELTWKDEPFSVELVIRQL